MDAVTEAMQREVALDCYQGTPLERVWCYIEGAQRELAEKSGLDSDSVSIDDAFKSYIWPFIVQMKNMVFFQDQAVIYSASETEESADKGFPKLTLAQVQQKYPGLSMRGTEAAINIELFGRVQGNRRVLASEKAFSALQMLARTRAAGMTQIDLKNALNVDARSMFHFIKILDLEGLVSKVAAFTKNGHTNLIFLRRFAKPESEEAAMASGANNEPDQTTAMSKLEFLSSMVRKSLRKKISDLLQQAETGVMVESDVMDAVKLDWCNLRERKYFHRVTRDLWENGCIEVLRLQVKDPEGPGLATSGAAVLGDEEAQAQVEEDEEEEVNDNNNDGDDDGDDDDDADDNDRVKGAAEPEEASVKQEQMDIDDAAKAGGSAVVKQERSSRSEPALEKRKRKQQQKTERIKRRRMELKRQRDCLRDGYSFRRCLRFVKPYVQKRKVRDRVGIPMQNPSAADGARAKGDASNGISVDVEGDDVEAEAEDDVEAEVENEAIYDDDSDDNADLVDVEALKEKDDVRHLLSRDEVRIGLSSVMPLETQMFRLIALSGRNGTVAKALQFILRENSNKLITRVLMRLEKTPYVDARNMLPGVLMDPIEDADKKEYIISAVEEFVGREHRKRYFANPRAQAAIAALTAKRAAVLDSGADAAEDTEVIVNRAVAQIQAQDQAQAQGQDQGREAAEGARATISSGELCSRADKGASSCVVSDANLHHASETRMDVDSVAGVAKATMGTIADAESKTGNNQTSVPDHSPLAEGTADVGLPADARVAMTRSSYGHIADIVREARERKVAVNGVLRERVILAMLQREKMFTCDMYAVTRCEKEVREFVLANRDAAEVTQSMVDSALKHTLDKRTLLRTVKAMAAQEKVWLHLLTALPQSKALNRSRVESIVIARDVDPHGPLVEAFIAEIHDRRSLRPMHSIAVPRKVSEDIDVTRTEGAAQRDARYMVYARGLSTARVANNVGGHERWKRINRCKTVENDSLWDRIAKRLYRVPLRIARICDLHAFLASALPGSVDGVTVFDNCSFRSSYFFSHLPLELYLQLCGGLSHLPFAHRYIRYGEFSSDLDSDNEGDDDSLATSPVEEIEARLATPICKLPKELYTAVTSYAARSRTLIQPIVRALYLLRLLRPISTVAEVASVGSHCDSRDPVAVPENSRVLSLGYQLVRYARVVSRESIVSMAELPVFVDDRVFDILSTEDNVDLYWDAVEKLHRNAEPKLPSTHPLNGIDHYRYWARKLTLNPAQIESLKEFVQEEERTTPLDDHEALQRAAEAAGVSVELARRFYRNVIGKMTQVDIKRRNMTKRRLFIRERIRAAKEKAIAEGRLPASTKKSRPERQLKRRPWSESESNMVAMAYAILRNHAHSHRHPFLLFNIAKLFPNRAHVANPNEGVRGRWARLRRDQAYASMADTLYVVWKYVLRDAVESDILYDEPDLTDFDLQAAAKHYREVLNQMSLDSLVEKYADEINEDIEGGTEALISGKWRLTRVLADKRRGPRQPRTRSSRKPADGAVSGRHGPRIPFTYRYRLPKTMVGNEGRYLISLTAEPRGRGGRVHIDDNGFPEDMYMEGISTRSRRQLAYSGMLVAHDSNRDLGDHFSQVTTLLSGSGLSDADTVVAHAADSSIYPDCMSSLSPVERTIDLDDLVSKVNSLIIGEDVEEGQGDRDTEARADNSEFLDDPAEQYAHVAAMQAMLINLTLTPESEYEVASGHRLLSTDERSATAALQALSQNAVVNRLTSMATTTGVGNSQDADTSADAAAEPAQKGNGGKSTVVVHKTTGVLRVAFSDAPRIGQNSEGFSSEDAAQERSVPGRGISISEKFLLAISSTLPPGYTTKTVLDPMSVAGSSLTDERLSAGEFSHLCRLISDGALWLRQEYSADPLNRVLGAFAGFKDQEVGSMLQFKVAAIVDHNLLRSFEKNRRVDAAAGQGQLPEEMQELVRRLVVCVVDFLGPLGASVYELKQLFGQLAKSVHGIPEQLAAWMADELQIASLMRDLVSQGCLASAGSSDLRYVSTSMFKKHWVAHANDMDYLPYVGQNLGGAVNTEYTLGMLASLVGHILDSPGISQAVLMRRHYAPFVPRAEVVRYLEILVNLGIVYGQWDPESFGGTTTYRLAKDHYQCLNKIHTCLAIKKLAP